MHQILEFQDFFHLKAQFKFLDILHHFQSLQACEISTEFRFFT